LDEEPRHWTIGPGSHLEEQIVLMESSPSQFYEMSIPVHILHLPVQTIFTIRIEGVHHSFRWLRPAFLGELFRIVAKLGERPVRDWPILGVARHGFAILRHIGITAS